MSLLLAVPAPPLAAQGTPQSRSVKDVEARLATADSNDARAQYDAGIAYWAAKRWDDAERALRLAVQIEPRYPQAWLALGWLPYARRPKLWKQLGKRNLPDSLTAVVRDADALQRRAFVMDPLVDLGIMSAVVPHEGRRLVFGRGLIFVLESPFDAFRDGHYNTAFAMFDVAIQRASRDSVPPFVLWYAALSAAHLKFYDEASADLQALLSRTEQVERDSIVHVPLRTNDFRYVLALMKLGANKPADARSLLQDLATNDVGFYMAHVKLAELYESYQMWTNAVAEGRLAITANPDDPSLLTDLGILLRQADSLPASETALTESMEANPRDPRPPYYLGLTELQMGKADAARTAFQRFLAMAPSRDSAQVAEVQRYLAMLH